MIAAVAMAPTASAVALGYSDDHYVGQITPGTPANEASEAVYAQYLVDLVNGVESDTTDVAFIGIPTHQNFNPDPGSALPSPLPDFGPAGSHVTTGSGANDISGTYDITGYQYLYAYYGNGAGDSGKDGQVWYVGDLSGDVTIPTKALSGVLLGGGTSVPDGGATLALLGVGVLGVSALRRRFSK